MFRQVINTLTKRYQSIIFWSFGLQNTFSIQYEKLSINSLPTDNILDSSKLKDFADDNFRFHEIGRKFSKQIENTVGKGEIARYEQFLLFPQCFQKT